MDYQKLYSKKLVTAETAASIIHSGDWVDFGFVASTPVVFDAALAKRLPELHDVNFRGGVLMKTPEIFKIENPADHFSWNSWHMGGIERKAATQGFVFYAPIRYSELPRYYRESIIPSDAAVFQTAPMDSHGYFNFGVTASHLSACCEMAKTVILEINKNMPVCLGGTENSIHLSQVDMIIEGNHSPIPELPSGTLSETDQAIAKLIVEEIPDGACLQLGIGSMPNAVGKMIAESDLKDLGVHTEMYVDAFVDMAEAGKITGLRKKLDKGRQVYAFAAGTRRLYNYLDHNPSCMTAAVNYTNDIRTIAAQDHFISINNAVDMDLFGQVNAESAGIKNISGAGGQLDFVLGSYLSDGGKSFICCSSTYTGGDGVLHSRICPTLTPGSIVTDTRANVQYLVTEYGKVCLKGLTAWQRAEAIISIAHPRFRDYLTSEAEKMNIWKRSSRR